MMRFEETELRLGLPGNAGEVVAGSSSSSSVRKRGFCETVDLLLNLSSSTTADKMEAPPCACAAVGGKLLEAATPSADNKMDKNLAQAETADPDPAKPHAKAQVVGWPPVRSFRKKMLQTAAPVKQSAANNTSSGKEKEVSAESEVAAGRFVKVSMDGAPYLRKVDLKMYASYKQLSDALAKMFSSFSATNYNEAAGGMKDFMKDKPMMSDSNISTDDYVPTDEDRNGDWMLVGDVPWEMFVVSCKRQGRHYWACTKRHGETQEQGLAGRGGHKCKLR